MVLAALPYSQTVLCFVPVPRCVYTVDVEKPRSPKKTVCAVDTKHVEIPQTRSMDKVVDMLVVILWQVPTVQLSKALEVLRVLFIDWLSKNEFPCASSS